MGYWFTKDKALKALEILQREVIDYPWDQIGQKSWLHKVWLVDGTKQYRNPSLYLIAVEVDQGTQYKEYSGSISIPAFCPQIGFITHLRIDDEYTNYDKWPGETKRIWRG